MLFPIVKCQNEGIALGFVTSRLFEAAVIVIGIVSLLVVVTLRQTGAGGTDAELSVRSCWDTRRYPAFASRWDTPALGRTLRWLAVLAATLPATLPAASNSSVSGNLVGRRQAEGSSESVATRSRRRPRPWTEQLRRVEGGTVCCLRCALGTQSPWK